MVDDAKGMRRYPMAGVFCWEEERTVMNDWVVQYQNRVCQISRDNRVLPKTREKVTVRRLLDGTVQLVYKGQTLRYREREPGALVRGPEAEQAGPRVAAKLPYTPAPTHPWRHGRLSKRNHAMGEGTACADVGCG